MSFHVQIATAADAQLVGELVARLIEELSGGEKVDREAMTATALSLLAANSVIGLVAMEGGQALGLLMLNECAAIYAGGRFGEITELYVMPERRSSGVAARLVTAAADLGRDRGWKRIEVGAPELPAWARTKAFYEREGFTEVGPRLKRML
ncbi:GNAT family N-acetyltransferase [Frigidibacter sp. RF13]|uniref:GNAT family N-acetyltransferase n=1 Tax=Frigidibacter sp. RF13 TaxID=2997340 RepID=UPI00226E3D05|nr:GNAT family N-acetyltransferase [Frigidibacter sp. RF13]MCY1128257.1 GNAT family N-acetyltransferase [Frigidibacter sp. RF13]